MRFGKPLVESLATPDKGENRRKYKRVSRRMRVGVRVEQPMFSGNAGEVFIMPAARHRVRAELILNAADRVKVVGVGCEFGDRPTQMWRRKPLRTRWGNARVQSGLPSGAKQP